VCRPVLFPHADSPIASRFPKTECKAIVDSFGSELTQCITASNFNATQCCVDVTLCKDSKTPLNKAAIKAAIVGLSTKLKKN
jgi:hypothetical protein